MGQHTIILCLFSKPRQTGLQRNLIWIFIKIKEEPHENSVPPLLPICHKRCPSLCLFLDDYHRDSTSGPTWKSICNHLPKVSFCAHSEGSLKVNRWVAGQWWNTVDSIHHVTQKSPVSVLISIFPFKPSNHVAIVKVKSSQFDCHALSSVMLKTLKGISRRTWVMEGVNQNIIRVFSKELHTSWRQDKFWPRLGNPEPQESPKSYKLLSMGMGSSVKHEVFNKFYQNSPIIDSKVTEEDAMDNHQIVPNRASHDPFNIDRADHLQHVRKGCSNRLIQEREMPEDMPRLFSVLHEGNKCIGRTKVLDNLGLLQKILQFLQILFGQK